MQILVMGMHRSGTSVVARLLNLMGAYFGTEDVAMLPKEANPKGYWERLDVYEVNEALLSAGGCRWDQVAGFDAGAVGESLSSELEQRIREIVAKLETQRPWFLKDPRLCVTLPLWQPYLDDPVYVFVHRSPLESARSLETHEGVPVPIGIALWNRYLIDALRFTEGSPRVSVTHCQVLSDPVGTAGRLFRELNTLGANLGKPPQDREIQSFIEPGLHRERAAEDELAAFLTGSQMALHQALEAGKLDSLPEFPLDHANYLLCAYELACKAEKAQAEAEEARRVQQELNQRLQKLQAQYDEESRKSKWLYETVSERERQLEVQRQTQLGEAIVARLADAGSEEIWRRLRALEGQVAALQTDTRRATPQRENARSTTHGYPPPLEKGHRDEGERNALRGRSDDLKQRLADMERTSAVLSHQNEELESTRKALEQELERLRKQNQELEAARKALQADLATPREKT